MKKIKTKIDGLLSREDFNREVFLRSCGKCVFCHELAINAHHILDRKLFLDGGYYLNNGAAVCEVHHWQCEQTRISVSAVYQACGITTPVLPLGFSTEKTYDKWGNEFTEQGWLAGPLIHDDGARKALTMGGVLWQIQS